jgi:hypothetical protein
MPGKDSVSLSLLANNKKNASIKTGVPKGIRTPVAAVKGRCPRPLDDGDCRNLEIIITDINHLVEISGIEPLTSCMPCKRSPS